MLRSTLLLLVLLCTCVRAQLHADPVDPALPVIKKIFIVDHLGRDHFKIRTSTATYLYDPLAEATFR